MIQLDNWVWLNCSHCCYCRTFPIPIFYLVYEWFHWCVCRTCSVQSTATIVTRTGPLQPLHPLCWFMYDNILILQNMYYSLIVLCIYLLLFERGIYPFWKSNFWKFLAISRKFFIVYSRIRK